jgi:NO-binding membrane sensor protein with MHYT domain
MGMVFLDVGQNFGLVAASVVIALAAGFTGLTLSTDLSQKSVARRKRSIAASAIALGGGIWSMHFVAMLGIQMPILFYYDAAMTLASALLAILIVGTALLLLHFRERTPTTVSAAGAMVGVGILAMHYVGMAGLQLCRPVYTPLGIGLSVISAIGLCIAAFWVAYGRRTNRSILLGTLCFGFAVCAVHFVATANTRFVAVPTLNEFGPVMSNETLALVVIISSFIIFGAFLWMGVTFLIPSPVLVSSPDLAPSVPTPLTQQLAVADPKPFYTPATPQAATRRLHIPCERNGVTHLIDPDHVVFVRAEGHYTNVYTNDAQHFCAWPITEAVKRLTAAGFIKTHRSYLVNPRQVKRFERFKDHGVCRFAAAHLPPVPVSRSNLKVVRGILGL